jgi:mRNA interferase RelE/StbE
VLIFEFKKKAAKEIDKLPLQIRQRILKKLKFYSLQENPLRFAEKLKDYRFGEYRFRIGDYRVLFDVENHKITILKVGHRKNIYKDC